MATQVSPTNPYHPGRAIDRPRSQADVSLVEQILRPLASLKLTVALFAMMIFIIWAGTVAQKESGVWVAIGQYFRTWFAFVEFKVFAFFLPKPPDWAGGFYFPGGRLIGCVMAVNLIAAHAIRFKLQAKDWRLPAGLAVVSAGIGLFFLVVIVGNHLSGVQAGSPVEWSTLWTIFKLGLAGLVGAGIARLTMMDWSRSVERNLLLGGTAALGTALAWLLVRSDFVPNPSSLRIMWQLIEGEAVGLTLLAGCMLLFKKRAGIVLIHAGIGLMMFNELYVDLTSKEPQQLSIQEGQAKNFTEDSRTTELAIIDSSHPEKDDVVVVPRSMLQPGKVIRDPELPFDIEVLAYYPNSNLRPVKAGEPNKATVGVGLENIAIEEKPISGTDTSRRFDMPSAYVKLRKKAGGESLGVYLVSLWLEQRDNPVKLVDNGMDYDLALRFKRNYKPYVVRLVKTEEHDWPGTNDPQYYSSDIHIINEKVHEDRSDHIWMNNPLRFDGETFYQSGFFQNQKTGQKTSTLSVVDNQGWMIPYIGCMIVVTGLGFHFLSTLVRFMRRQAAEPAVIAAAVAPAREKPGRPILLNEPLETPDSPTWLSVGMSYLPWVVVAFCAAMALARLIPTSAPDDVPHLSEFGALPIVHEGRLKPIDTFARTVLWTVSDRQSFEDADGNKRPAVQWLLEMMAAPRVADTEKVFYITNPELLDTLGLARIKSHYYSIDDLVAGAAKVKDREKKSDKKADGAKESPDDAKLDLTTAEKYVKGLLPQLEKAYKADPEKRTPYQESLIDFGRRLMAYVELQQVFSDRFPSFSDDDIKQHPEEAYQQTVAGIRKFDKPPKREDESQDKPKPLLVPIRSLDEVWHSYAAAKVIDRVNVIGGQHPRDEATLAWDTIFAAYRNNKPAEFNAAIAKYRDKLDADPPKLYDSGTVNFEATFNHLAPSESAFGIYLLAILFSLAGLLLYAFEWSKTLQKTAFWMIVLAVALHTFTLFARIHISGRPPVTTLYSAAVFLGWGGALLGLALELVFKTGLGNLIAAALGVVGIGLAGLIFQFLDAGKDTIVVPEAVLDTRFWLGTHVVCEVLGYATTFVAGGLGILYVLLGLFTPVLSQRLQNGQSIGRNLAKMIYGTVCFAIFFSFFGTVLGGLWADDSWGRFWGWDPKENGALIIVIWNALVLHALWDKQVSDRGLAVLVIGGNIVTTWSMFGVNFLGVGLHSYGFSSANGWLVLGAVAAVNLALAALGCLPKHLWASFRELPQEVEA